MVERFGGWWKGVLELEGGGRRVRCGIGGLGWSCLLGQ